MLYIIHLLNKAVILGSFWCCYSNKSYLNWNNFIKKLKKKNIYIYIYIEREREREALNIINLLVLLVVLPDFIYTFLNKNWLWQKAGSESYKKVLKIDIYI